MQVQISFRLRFGLGFRVYGLWKQVLGIEGLQDVGMEPTRSPGSKFFQASRVKPNTVQWKMGKMVLISSGFGF